MIEKEYLLAGMWVREHRLSVPLNWSDENDPRRITVFARELSEGGKAAEDLPCLLFLQGGPGGKSPRPTSKGGWLGEALKSFRVILLDQRGTGQSSRIESSVIRNMDVDQTADYLSYFRADSIVADAEHLRKTQFGGRKWSTLGQSFGGFITLTYLSQAPEGLDACYITGGLPSIKPDAEQLYQRTYQKLKEKNQIFFSRYPHMQQQINRIADVLNEQDVYLPDGDILTVQRCQQLGIQLGMSEGYENLLWLFDEAFNHEGELSDTFLSQVMHLTGFTEHPLYAVLHESIYADNHSGATHWAAQRVHDTLPEFQSDCRPLLLTGEMIYPWMFDEMQCLRPFRDAVHQLAQRSEWQPLYDAERLAANTVPVVAAVYYNDMYVDVGLSLETAKHIGKVETWITSEFEHNGLRVGNVFAHLRQMMALRGVN